MQNSARPEYVDKVGRCVRNAPQCCWRPLCAVCVPSAVLILLTNLRSPPHTYEQEASCAYRQLSATYTRPSTLNQRTLVSSEHTECLQSFLLEHSLCNALKNCNPQIGGMREGDYLVAIGDNDVKWSSHADVVKEIKSAENTLRLRLVTPMDRSLGKTSYKEKASIKSSSVGGGSVSPTSTTSSSSSSGLYTPEEGLSPASSESSGSTR